MVSILRLRVFMELVANPKRRPGNYVIELAIKPILVPRVSRPRASSLGPAGTHGTGSASKLAVVSKARALELGRFSTRNNFHSEVLRRNEVFVFDIC